MNIALPYRFNTGDQSGVILKGICILTGLILIPGLYKFLIYAPNPVSALGIVGIGGLLTCFAYVVVKRLRGATGEITKNQVVIKPSRFLGIASNAPEGCFGLDQFSSLLVQRIAFAGNRFSPHERVFLMGKNGTPNILIARTRKGAGMTLGRELSELLGLSVSETIAPYI
jgi:hypothetical protein